MAHKVRYTDSFSTNGQSEVIAGAYLAENGDVYVEFKNGRLAGYRNVGSVQFNLFKSAVSFGRFYNDRIKNWYTGLNADVFFESAVSVAKNYGVAQNNNYVVESSNTSRFDVVYTDDQAREVVFPIDATSEQEAVKLAQETVAKFAGLNLKINRVVHYFV